MSVLSSRANFHDAFYRLVGTTTSDGALTEQGESADEVADRCLTAGIREGQRFLLESGYNAWVTRSSAITWSGTDAADGGKYSALPTDFMRCAGDEHRSSLVRANGDPWGQEVPYEMRSVKGDGFYLKNAQIWLLRTAAVPSTIYLEYHAQHEAFSSSLADIDISFPADCRMLVVALAADHAKNEGWFPLADKDGIREAVATWKQVARGVSRGSKTPRKVRPAPKLGNHYY